MELNVMYIFVSDFFFLDNVFEIYVCCSANILVFF